MEILVDSREQRPYSEDIYKPLGLKCTVKKLDIGDYSIKGKEKEVAIERKTLDDFIHSITHERERFEKEFIIQALRNNKGRINLTAEQANIPKNTLLRKIKKYNINPKEYGATDNELE